MVCCAIKPGTECSEEDIKLFCAEQLGELKTPKVVRLVDSIPKDQSGKVERAKLKNV
jgi:fatty-acyl-CoA synthase